MQVEIHSDSSVTRAFAQRAGLGKQKQGHTRLPRIQKQVEQGRIGVRWPSGHSGEQGRLAD
eukprot:1890929-Amphidinium_carterae.1